MRSTKFRDFCSTHATRSQGVVCMLQIFAIFVARMLHAAKVHGIECNYRENLHSIRSV
jgi:hypothetical protein